MAGPARFEHPGKECDIVLKGGVASGIVYPQAILTLAEKYRFRSIGGSSAGAIAAALAAAAEFGREAGGFEVLDGIRRDLLHEGAIFALFQPSERTRPLWETLTCFLGVPSGGALTPREAVRRLRAALPETTPHAYRRGAWRGGLIGGALGLGVGLLLAFIVTGLWWLIAVITRAAPASVALLLILAAVSGVPLGVAGAWVGGRAGGLVGARSRSARLPCGICPRRGSASAPAAARRPPARSPSRTGCTRTSTPVPDAPRVTRR